MIEIELNFHWAWFIMAALVIFGVAVYIRNYDNGSSLAGGARMLIGMAVLSLCILLALTIGGIFIW